MSRIRGTETKIEIKLRKELWRLGYRYRKNPSGYFGKPDILLKKYCTVIFVDSCFWHGCPKHYRIPLSNVEFWKEKIERNRARDKKVNRHYKKMGWKVIRIWEHEIKNDMNKAIAKIVYLLRS